MAAVSKQNAETIRQAFREAQGDIDALRGRIAELQEALKRVDCAPRARADVERFIDAEIAEAIAKRPFEIGALWSRDLRPHEYRTRFNTATAGIITQSGGDDSGKPSRSVMLGGDMFAVFAAWDAERLKALLLADAPDGMTEDARAVEMSRLEREIEVAEIAEEVACREIEDELGNTIMRRADVNPAILLAPTSELTGRRT
ncbi:hypothetical protein [Bosea massiliensis]|uniref:Uncharacterized protein n=1 Tax=Bosea massiliensis TaxID=151419 RepID=A0ABW0PA98_9HYPH